MLICTVTNLGENLVAATCVDIAGDVSSRMTVNVNANLGDPSQLRNQLPRCKHSSTVLGSYVAAHSTCLSLLLPQARKRGMKVCLSLFYI